METIRAEPVTTGKRKKVIVVTHHAPLIHGTSSPQYDNNAWSTAVSTDLISNERQRHIGEVVCWIYGHTYHFAQLGLLGEGVWGAIWRVYILPKAPYLLDSGSVG